MARKESDNQPFGVYHDKSIISAFRRQEDRANRKRLREMETKEEYMTVEIPGSMTPAEVSRRLEQMQKQDYELLNCPTPPRSPKRMRLVEPQEATESDEEAQHERMRADEERIETEEYQVNFFILLFRQNRCLKLFFSLRRISESDFTMPSEELVHQADESTLGFGADVVNIPWVSSK
jgi:hypothetical protein